ncbi:hypothetical protein VTO73DRAFT_10279 [Trametes versicolor]
MEDEDDAESVGTIDSDDDAQGEWSAGQRETLRNFFGEVPARDDDEDRVSEGTPTPDHRRKDDELREPSPDPFAPAATQTEDPYGMGNTSMNMDMAYSLASNAGLDGVPLSQTGVTLVPLPGPQQRPEGEATPHQTAAESCATAHADGNPRKRARRDSSEEQNAGRDAQAAAWAQQTKEDEPEAATQHPPHNQQVTTQGEALPPYAPPPTDQSASGSVQAPAFLYPPMDPETARILATVRLFQQHETASALSHVLGLPFERAETLLGAPYTGPGGVLSVMSKLPADAFWQGGATSTPSQAASSTGGPTASAPVHLPGPPAAPPQTASRRTTRRPPAAAANAGGPPGLPMGPNRAMLAPYAPQFTPIPVAEPTRDPRVRPTPVAKPANTAARQSQPRTTAQQAAATEREDRTQDMDVDVEHAARAREHRQNSIAAMKKRIPEWAFQSLEPDEETEEDRMEEETEPVNLPPARTEEEYWGAIATLGLTQIPGDRFPEIHEREVGGRLQNCDRRALEKWLACPKACRCLLAVFGIGNMDGETVAVMQTRIEKILEQFLGTTAFRLDPPKENQRGVPPSEAPKAWMLSNIPALAKEIMLIVFGWAHETVAFHVFDDDEDEIPELVAALTGISQKNAEKILDAIVEEFQQDDMFAAIEDIFRVGTKQSASQLRALANAAIASIRIERRYVNASNEESPRIVYVYMKTTGADPAKWALWQKGLKGHAWSFGAGRVTTRRGIERCGGCHGTDHKDSHCPYLDRKKVPGWRTTHLHWKDDIRQPKKDDQYTKSYAAAPRDRQRNAQAGPSRMKDGGSDWTEERRPRDNRRAQDEQRQRGPQGDAFYPDGDEGASDGWGAPQRPRQQGTGTQRSRNGRR